MVAQIINDPILKRFRTALEELYGDRVERVILYGSITGRIRIMTLRYSSRTTEA